MKSLRENLEFVTDGFASVGGGSGIQRSASAAVIWATSKRPGFASMRCRDAMPGGEKQDAPGDLQIPRGATMGTPTNQASDFLRR